MGSGLEYHLEYQTVVVVGIMSGELMINQLKVSAQAISTAYFNGLNDRIRWISSTC